MGARTKAICSWSSGKKSGSRRSPDGVYLQLAFGEEVRLPWEPGRRLPSVGVRGRSPALVGARTESTCSWHSGKRSDSRGSPDEGYLQLEFGEEVRLS